MDMDCYYEDDYDDDGSLRHSIGEYNSSPQTYNLRPIFSLLVSFCHHHHSYNYVDYLPTGIIRRLLLEPEPELFHFSLILQPQFKGYSIVEKVWL